MDLKDEPFEVALVDTSTGYTGQVWDVVEDRFEYGDGELVRHYVDHPGAVAVVALDESGRVLLLQQYRHPIRSRDWEIPAGLRDVVGEDPVICAQRELAEEADLVADQWSMLGEFALTPGGSNELIRIYLATGLRAAEEAFERHGEEADIEIAWVPLEEAIRAVAEGRMSNATAALGLMLAAQTRR